MIYDRIHFVKVLNSNIHKCEDILITALCSSNVFSMPSSLEEQLSTQNFNTALETTCLGDQTSMVWYDFLMYENIVGAL